MGGGGVTPREESSRLQSSWKFQLDVAASVK